MLVYKWLTTIPNFTSRQFLHCTIIWVVCYCCLDNVQLLLQDLMGGWRECSILLWDSECTLVFQGFGPGCREPCRQISKDDSVSLVNWTEKQYWYSTHINILVSLISNRGVIITALLKVNNNSCLSVFISYANVNYGDKEGSEWDDSALTKRRRFIGFCNQSQGRVCFSYARILLLNVSQNIFFYF